MSTFVVIDYGWAEVAVAAVAVVAAEVAAAGRTAARIVAERRVTDDVVVGAVADEGVVVVAVAAVGDEGVVGSEPECWRPWQAKEHCWQASWPWAGSASSA